LTRRLWYYLVAGSATTLLALGSPALAPSASAATPACGDVITTSITLTADVGPCIGTDGLVVGADGITINLNGHRVIGDPNVSGNRPVNSGCTFPSPAPIGPCFDALGNPVPGAIAYQPADVVGIHSIDHSNVTILGGTAAMFTAGTAGIVSGFAAGVAIEGGNNNTVRYLVAQDNIAPCIGENFTTQAVGTFGDGIAVFSSTNNHIDFNLVQRNGPFSGISVVTNTFAVNQPVPDQPLPTGNVISRNQVLQNNFCFGEIGIRLEGPGASGNTVFDNTVSQSFLEGIGVLSVNNINFTGAFPMPPALATCQNRNFPTSGTPSFTGTGNFLQLTPTTAHVTLTSGTFPANAVGSLLFNPSSPIFAPGAVSISAVTSPTTAILSGVITASTNGVTFSLLPLCPLLPNQVANSNNIIRNNVVTRNGAGGVETPVGPNPAAPRISLQTRAGIQLLSFCGFGTLNGSGNSVERNNVQFNAGDGIGVGGCTPFPTPPSTTTQGFTNNRIVGNTSLHNNTANCPTGAVSPTLCTTPRFDLHDTSLTPSGPAPGTVASCDNNYWFGNIYGTAFPACTTLGGRQVGPGGPPPLPQPPPRPRVVTVSPGSAAGAKAAAKAPSTTRATRRAAIAAPWSLSGRLVAR
jgi:hypothetical protein